MFVIDPVHGLITRNDTSSRLPRRQMELFLFLYKHRGKNVSRDAMMNYLYQLDDNEPNIKILDVLVCYMRGRLRGLDLPIKTIWGFGYKLDIPASEKAFIVGSVETEVEA